MSAKKILFTHSYFMRFDPKQWAMGKPYPPLGTILAAAVMRKHGFDVALFDTMFAHSADEAARQIEQQQPRYFVIYDDGFNYLTKMCLTNMREAAFGMIRLAKQQGCTVIVSGSDSTDHYHEYLQQGADVVLIGEAEQTLPELIGNMDAGAGWQQLQGIAYLQNGGLIKNPARPVMKDLDALPLPAWDLVDIAAYKRKWLKSAGYFSLNVGTTRGCPFKCNWCAKPIYGNRYNSRSAAHVMDELRLLVGEFGADHIWFCDDIFGLKPGWVAELAGLIARDKLKFKFKIQSRADLLLQDEQVRLLAEAGCDTIWIGAESGSQKILDAMDKGITVSQIESAAMLMKKYGIKPSFFIQFGYPGETKEDIDLTIGMINRLLPFEVGISVSYPLPGTVFYNRVKQELKNKSNWTDSDEMALMFRNTFAPAYYKQLHRYVHRNYHQYLALNNFRQIIRHPFKADLNKIKKAASLLYYAPATMFEKIKLTQAEKL